MASSVFRLRHLLVLPVLWRTVTEAFGLYALSGKATAFIGPLAIALTTAYFAREASGFSPQDAQRLGVTPVVVLFVIALALLPFVKSGGRTPGTRTQAAGEEVEEDQSERRLAA